MRLKFRRASDPCRPTVNKQLDAGNEAAVVRGEENGGLANFVRIADPSQRDVAYDPLFDFFVHKHIQAGRLDHAGAVSMNCSRDELGKQWRILWGTDQGKPRDLGSFSVPLALSVSQFE